MLISGWLEFMFKSNCWWTPRYDWVWIRGISDCRTQQTTVPDTPHNEFRRKRRIPWSLLPWRKGQLQVTKERQAGQERNYMRYNHFFFFLICFIKARQLIPISIKLFRIEIKTSSKFTKFKQGYTMETKFFASKKRYHTE